MVKWKPTIVPQTSKQGKSLDARSDVVTKKICTVTTPTKDDENLKNILGTGTKTNMVQMEKYQIEPTKTHKEKLVKNDISKYETKLAPDNNEEEGVAFNLIKSFTPMPIKAKEFQSKDKAHYIEVRPSTIYSLSSLSTPQTLVQNQLEIPTNLKLVTDVSQSWSAMQPTTYFDHEKMLRALDHFIKNEIFHKIVFILSPSFIAFSRESQSLCQVVCLHLNIPSHEQESFWMINARYVEKTLNQKRSDVSNAMKKSFLGKNKISIFIFFFILICIFV